MDRPQIKLSNALRILTPALLVTLLSGAVWAQKLIKPVDGATVREKVRIAVAASAIPSGGYISVYIDDHFVGATAGETAVTESSKILPSVVFAWDSKLPFTDASGSSEGPKDGKHSLQVDIHNSSGSVDDSITSTFNLANKAPRLSPNDKVRMIYRYSAGSETHYKVRIDSRMGSQYSLDDFGTVPLLASYTVIQTVEDARPDGSALISYRVGAGGSCQVLGQVVALNGGKAGSSVYKEMDKFGQVISRNGMLQDNVLSRKGRRSLPDVLIELPRVAVKIGETWESNEKEEFSVEGVGDVLKLSSTNTLEDLEWERNQVCVKIKSVFTGLGRLVGGQGNPAPTRVDGQGTFYVGLKTGKLVKSIVTLTAFASLQPPSESSTSGPSGSTSSYNPSPADESDEDYGIPGRTGRPITPSAPPPLPYSSPSSSSSAPASSSGAASTSGTLRVTIETEL